MNNNINYGGGAPVGIGFCGLLTIVFIILKLTGYISWSWVWVLAPLWISWLVGIVFVLVMVLVALLITVHEEKKKGGH